MHEKEELDFWLIRDATDYCEVSLSFSVIDVVEHIAILEAEGPTEKVPACGQAGRNF